MRTTQELLDYVDRMVDIGVDKTELPGQFDCINSQPASGKQDESCEIVPFPLLAQADDHAGLDGDGI
ncbi:MAG TPA: hypothetical protein VGV18_09325 [Verrucomicrobiae bacterium]|nr:hypothetical protein [Verrucomicrobiae bacterium]